MLDWVIKNYIEDENGDKLFYQSINYKIIITKPRIQIDEAGEVFYIFPVLLGVNPCEVGKGDCP